MKKRKKKPNGYVMFDVIISIFVATVVLVSALAGAAQATFTVARSTERILESIDKRNAEEETRWFILPIEYTP